jgi:hypothetical protein
MSDQSLAVARYVQLDTKEPLEHGVIAAWYRCVCDHAPSGSVTVVQSRDDSGQPRIVQLVHRTREHQHCYLVPLTRDLHPGEIETIVRAFAKIMPELDFEIETNETHLITTAAGEISVDAAKHVALCTALAKQQHEAWVAARTEHGWRYGTKLDRRAKTHPLIRPWDQLPARFQKPDLNPLQKLLKRVNDDGYDVLEPDEWKKRVRKTRKGTVVGRSPLEL